MDIKVRRHPDWGAVLNVGTSSVRCAVGRGGIGHKRSEGDGISPIGSFQLRRVYFRPDRIGSIQTGLPSTPIERDHGWCDAPSDPNYNRLVRLPYPARTESMRRADEIYDLLVVVGFNDEPVVAGLGSAIFLHVARPDFSATEGCFAIDAGKLKELVEQLSVGDRIIVVG
jgi:L,D-peptidoglycan transpeptidase YkuD (ErfK/YbiS/YcfS/YnhG family)